MKKIQGTHIHLGTVDASGKFTSFAFARQASVSMKRKMIQVSSPDTGDSEEYIPGRKSWQMDCGCLLSDDETAVINAYNSGTKLKVAWRDETPDWSDKPKHAFIGYAYIESLKGTGNIHSMASFNISLQGTGALNYEEWESENIELIIAPTSLQPFDVNEYIITTNVPLPCDVILQFRNGRVTDNQDFTFHRGDTVNIVVQVSKNKYVFENWSLRKEIANYNILLTDEHGVNFVSPSPGEKDPSLNL